jgi:hypothetical protein
MGWDVELQVTECPSCGALYGIPKRKHDALMKEGGTAFCSSGHEIRWHRKTREDVERELREMRVERDQQRDEKWRFQTLWRRALKRAKKAEAKRG